MSVKKLIKGALAMSMVLPHLAGAQTVKQVERPPQYVVFAFDGSYTNSVWQYSRDFTKRQKNYGIDTRFTFFINPVYLLTPQSKDIYKAPGGKKGSAIGWGDDNNDVSIRVDQMNDAYLEGHEIASHAIGHWDGSGWSQADWDSEFTQFNYILDNMFTLNKMRPSDKQRKGLLFRNDIVGFRAPQLGVSTGLWPVLSKFDIQYDTSKVSKIDYWPQKNSFGTWNFPLGQIPEPGGARKWLSMDYNFCVRDSARILSEEKDAMSLTGIDPMTKRSVGNNDRSCLRVVSAEQKKKVKDNMMNLYRAYFNSNYYGNRAPLHIGHHFSAWMSGAYLEAFYEFANEVCGKPEVKCQTYAELMKFMDSKTSSQVAQYQAGNFAKMPRPKSADLARHLDMSVQMTAEEGLLKFSLEGRDAGRSGLKKYISFADRTLSLEEGIELAEIREAFKAGEEVVLRISVKDKMDKEILTSSFLIKDIGTEKESVELENIEDHWLAGHLDESHKDEHDMTRGH